MENKDFHYTYSAKEQQEIRALHDKYSKREESALERVRRLDAGVNNKAQVLSLVLGVLGTLILGFGMSLFMSELGAMMHLSHALSLGLGIALGVLGGALAGLAYPAYHLVLSRERERVAPEILRLTEELLK